MEWGELSELALLDHAESLTLTAQHAEVQLLQVAYQWAVVSSPDRLDPAVSARPGRERTKRHGGPGTQLVTEFAAARLGVRIGRSPVSAGLVIADAQDLVHRLPRLWGRVQALEVKPGYARHVARATRELSVAEAGWVDEAVAESADGRVSWARFEALVAGKVAAAAPALARAREEAARKVQWARRVRAAEGRGMGMFQVRADVATIALIDQAVTAVAAALKSHLPELSADERRVRALLLLICQQVPVDHPIRATVPDPADRQAADRPPWERDPDPDPDPDLDPGHRSSSLSRCPQGGLEGEQVPPLRASRQARRPGSPGCLPCDADPPPDPHTDPPTDPPIDPADADHAETPEQAAAAVARARTAYDLSRDGAAYAAAARARTEEQARADDRAADLAAALATEIAGIDLTALLPRTTLVVHLYGGTTGSGPDPGPEPELAPDPDTGELVPLDPVARIEGHGPVTLTWLRETLGLRTRFTVKPVMDLAGQAPVDAYEIPDRHREAVHLITPTDVYPYASHTGPGMQIDHTVPWTPDGPPGQSAIGNYGPMTLHHHRIKTHAAGFEVHQPFPGIYLWRDPSGRFHLVDHTGTRTVPATTTATSTTDRPTTQVVKVRTRTRTRHIHHHHTRTVTHVYSGPALDLEFDLGA